MSKPEKGKPNITINSKNFKLLENQQKIYGLLTKGDLVNSILDIYFKGTGSWCPKKVSDEEEITEEYSPKNTRRNSK